MGACTRFVPGHASVLVKRLQKVANERCLYRDIGNGTYYIRIYANGGDTYRSLETRRIREARQRLDIRRAAKAAAKLGLALEPDAAARQVAVYDVIETYEVADFPDKRGRARENSSAEKKNCETLKAYYVNAVPIVRHRADEKCGSWLILGFISKLGQWLSPRTPTGPVGTGA